MDQVLETKKFTNSSCTKFLQIIFSKIFWMTKTHNSPSFIKVSIQTIIWHYYLIEKVHVLVVALNTGIKWVGFLSKTIGKSHEFLWRISCVIGSNNGSGCTKLSLLQITDHTRLSAANLLTSLTETKFSKWLSVVWK